MLTFTHALVPQYKMADKILYWSIRYEMDQLLLDAKRLASRLREHNASSDALIGQANNLHFKVDAMKQVKIKIWTGIKLSFYNFISLNIKLLKF